jgi:hypothetical protein
VQASELVDQIDALLARGRVSPGSAPPSTAFSRMSDGDVLALTAAWGAAIERLAPPGSHYRQVLDFFRSKYHPGNHAGAAYLVGILNAFRADLSAGYLRSTEELIHADVFGDFLEMARELLDKGYKDAAAVIVGSVLEEHLRQLAAKHGVGLAAPGGTPKKADTLNAELEKAGAYNMLEQKQVTAWLGLRNDAAHGHYDRYDHRQVGSMQSGVHDFLIRHSA